MEQKRTGPRTDLVSPERLGERIHILSDPCPLEVRGIGSSWSTRKDDRLRNEETRGRLDGDDMLDWS